MAYEAFTEQSVVDHVRQLGLLEEGIAECEEIGDGNLNLVFRIRQGETSLIVKQALPYAKVVGESWPLTLDRSWIEQLALREFSKVVPQFVPDVLGSDRELAYTILEDLSSFEIVRTGFLKGESYPNLARHVGTFLGETLFATSDYANGPLVKKQIEKEYYNPELCDITEKLIFTDPYRDADSNQIEAALRPDVEQLWSDLALKIEVTKLKVGFVTKHEALLHGDLHTGSIFATRQETKIIDPEFAFYGPFGFDIGQIIAHLVFSTYAHPLKRFERFTEVLTVWETFEKTFRTRFTQAVEPFNTVGFVDELLPSILSDAIGYAGCELIRRTVGLAGVADLETLPDDLRIERKRHALELGTRLIKQRHQIQSIDQLIPVLSEVRV
ncbi:S-methyl-5-thioribose kinase [Exiguobacterium sp. NG55]|uniref:S-methyl-5-thioribose kinase n=1 Tax=Exiguobacterium sp. NG55 TaxID=375477 RepID=UPI0004DEFA84|nr:S-methyl-5-thioribose kinase [Exiguobacterium sp. NG55]